MGAGYTQGWGGRLFDWTVVPSEARRRVAPLVQRMQVVDGICGRMVTRGASQHDLHALEAALREPIPLEGPYGLSEAALVNPGATARAVRDICPGLHFENRTSEHKLPVYYLARTVRDWYAIFDVVTEDLHLSPGYELLDPRFAHFMRGRGAWLLRLSPLRSGAAAVLGHGAGDRAIDELLYTAARFVLSNAWHEDQRPVRMLCTRFGLSCLEAIEALYLVLTADLCELRSAASPDLVSFFEHAWPQPTVRALLVALPGLDGDRLARLPDVAKELYARLHEVFRAFLSVRVPWTMALSGQAPVRSLYDIFFASFYQAEAVGSLGDEPALQEAAAELDRCAAEVSTALVGAAGAEVVR